MGVGQQALGHAHRQERNAALFHQRAEFVVGLRIGGALAEDDQRTFCTFQHIERALDRIGRRNLRRRSIDHFHQRFLAGLRVHHLTEQFCGQIEIDAARTAGHRGADRARKTNADIGRMQHPERRLAQRLGNRELIHLFIVALLQVDDLAFGRTGDQDHRETVGSGVRERGQAVEKTGSRHRETHAGLFGQVTGDRCRITGVLLMAERNDADAGGLRHAAEVGDRDTRHAIDRSEVVELERIDDEVESVGLLALGFDCGNALYCCGHPAFSLSFLGADEFVVF